MRRTSVKKAILLARGSSLVALLAAVCSGCDHDDVKVIDVPRKDIPKEMYDKPIPPEAFKTIRPASREQMKKMEEALNKVKPGT